MDKATLERELEDMGAELDEAAGCSLKAFSALLPTNKQRRLH